MVELSRNISTDEEGAARGRCREKPLLREMGLYSYHTGGKDFFQQMIILWFL